MHWHMLRGDGLRSSLASRAGSVLSTNALIVASIALALGMRSQRPGSAVLASSLVTLTCIGISVVNASMALITVRRWRRQFTATGTKPFLYSYAGMHGDFEEFKSKLRSLAPEDVLELALVELWRCGNLYNYRYRRLRRALGWLLAAIILLFITIAVSAS